MKASASLATLALSALAFADEWDPLPKRDVATIQGVITQASSALTKLDTTVKAFNGQDFAALANDAGNLKMVLQQSATQIQATSPITAQEAITLQSSLGPIQTVGQSLVADLKAKKPQIQQASLCAVVQQQTADIGSAANGLLQATVMKVPAELQQVAGQLTSQFSQQLSDSALEFAPGNCTNAAGGSAAAAGITLANGTSNAGTAGGSTTTTSTTTSSAAATSLRAGVFGVVAVAAAGFLLL